MPVNITYRGSINTAAIAPNSVVNKNAPLSNAEIDGNFKSIQDTLANISANAVDINFQPSASLVSVNVQGAIEEVDGKLNNKQDLLVSGSNIKTIGSESLIGAGNIPVKTVGGQNLLTAGDIPFKTISSQPIIGTGNIDFITINGTSVIGTGNISLTAGASIDDSFTGTTKTWSSKKIDDEIELGKTEVKNDLLGGAGPSFDTLKKIADALASGTGLEVTLTAQIAGKQDTLVDSGPGANFKTVEGQSLLGAGNLDLVTIDGNSLVGSNDIKFKTVGGVKISNATGNVDFKTVGGVNMIGAGDIPVPTINDNSTTATEVWSASKVNTELGKKGDVTLVGIQTLTNKTITGLKESFVSMASNAIDLSQGNVFAKTISGATSLSVSNAAIAGSVSTFILELTNPGTNVSWWSNIRWAGGTAPTLTASGTDILGFYTRDGGSNWRGLVLAKDSK